MAARNDLTFSLLQFMSALNPNDPIIKEQYTSFKYPAAHAELQSFREECNKCVGEMKTNSSCETEKKS